MTKDDKPDAWMPLYIGDWDSGTRHLDCEQDGAYGRLVRHYWKNGPLPDDDAQLARIVGMELRRWKKVRSAIQAFFIVADGIWRHKRVDEELVRWAEKRRKAIERASAGGRAKAAKSSATSTPQAVLKRCTSASSTEVESSTSSSTLCDRTSFLGPKEVWLAFLAEKDDAWSRSYIEPCGWQDLPDRALIAPNSIALGNIESALRSMRGNRPAALVGLTVVLKARAA